MMTDYDDDNDIGDSTLPLPPLALTVQSKCQVPWKSLAHVQQKMFVWTVRAEKKKS